MEKQTVTTVFTQHTFTWEEVCAALGVPTDTQLVIGPAPTHDGVVRVSFADTRRFACKDFSGIQFAFLKKESSSKPCLFGYDM